MYDKEVHNILRPKNPSKPHENKSNIKTKKDTVKWCNFHKSLWHNTDECHSKQSLVAEIKEKELKPNLENIGKRQIIDADPISTIKTKIIKPEDPEEGEHIFHSYMWVKVTSLHFIVDHER
jgi:hypothetical protein